MVTTQQNSSQQTRSEMSDNTNEGSRTDQVRQRARDAYDGARQSVSDVGRRASSGIDEAPLVALAGGFAVGALIASLLPRTKAEEDLVRPTANMLKEKARTAADAAREAGTSRLRELGLTPDTGREKLREVVEGVSDAAKTSAQAAVGSVRKEGPQQSQQ